MTRAGRALLFFVLGVKAVQLVVTGDYAWFVQQRMRVPLLAAGVVILALGVADGLFEGDTDSHKRRNRAATSRASVAPRIGWLLALPTMVLIAVAPTSLGASAANRIDAYVPSRSSGGFERIDTSSGGPVRMRMYDFLDRAVWDEAASLAGIDVVLEGIVVNAPTVPDGFILTRFMVSCCAADGVPLQVHLRGVNRPLKNDTWVRATVRWVEPPVPYDQSSWPWMVEADAVRVEVMKRPGNPYESPY